jgi:hypothetical protein
MESNNGPLLNFLAANSPVVFLDYSLKNFRCGSKSGEVSAPLILVGMPTRAELNFTSPEAFRVERLGHARSVALFVFLGANARG